MVRKTVSTFILMTAALALSACGGEEPQTATFPEFAYYTIDNIGQSIGQTALVAIDR